MTDEIGLRVTAERCASCIYRLKYDDRTRKRIRADCLKNDGFIRCHSIYRITMCRGYFDQHYERQTGCTALQLARRFADMFGKLYYRFVPLTKKSQLALQQYKQEQLQHKVNYP